MKIEIPEFKAFIDNNISGKFLINPFWLEHLLNLFYQGYIGEVWEEVQDTLMNHKKTIEDTAYGIIGSNFNKERFAIEKETAP